MANYSILFIMTLRFFLAILLVSFVFLLSDHAKAFSDTSDFIDKIKQDMASDKPLADS